MNLQDQYNLDGTIVWFKAHLIVQEYKQEHDLDCIETFSLVAKMPKIRILLIVALTHKLSITQLDVFDAFLPDILTKQSTWQPLGFKDPHLTWSCMFSS